MRAVAVIPGTPRSARLLDLPLPRARRGEVLLRVLRVGVDGTDSEIDAGHIGQTPPGEGMLILGHESFAQVERVPDGVRGFRSGDTVVATVRRPCPQRCVNCVGGENDMCRTGGFRERGIKGLHGFLQEFTTESPEYLVKVPRAFREVGVLLEPLSIVEKGIRQAEAVQRRLLWRPRRAAVLGAGAIGLLGTLLLRLRGLATTTFALDAAESPRAAAVRRTGARYLDARERDVRAVAAADGPFDLILEATGASPVAFAAIEALAPNGVLCLMGVSAGDRRLEIPADRLNLHLVLNNQVVFGTVNANRRYFVQGIRDFAAAERRWPGLLRSLITKVLPPEAFREALDRDPADIKTVVDFAA